MRITELPSDDKGPLVLSIPVLDPETGRMKLDECGKVQWTGTVREDFGEVFTSTSEEYDAGSFEKRCLKEFWSKHPTQLIANVDWSTDPNGFADMGSKVRDLWGTVLQWCRLAYSKFDTWPVLVGDNIAFDYGEMDRLLCKYMDWHVTNYIPDENGDKKYQSVRDDGRWWALVRKGAIPKEDPLVECEHTHLASDDALSIAARYAAYSTKYPYLA
jgi:hypothetical protein